MPDLIAFAYIAVLLMFVGATLFMLNDRYESGNSLNVKLARRARNRQRRR